MRFLILLFLPLMLCAVELPKEVAAADLVYTTAVEQAQKAYDDAVATAVDDYCKSIDVEIIKATEAGDNALLVALVNKKQLALKRKPQPAVPENPVKPAAPPAPVLQHAGGGIYTVDETRVVEYLKGITAEDWKNIRTSIITIPATTKGVQLSVVKNGWYLVIPNPTSSWQRNEFPECKWDGANDGGAALAYQVGAEAKARVVEAPVFQATSKVAMSMMFYGARSRGSIQVKLIQVKK